MNQPSIATVQAAMNDVASQTLMHLTRVSYWLKPRQHYNMYEWVMWYESCWAKMTSLLIKEISG